MRSPSAITCLRIKLVIIATLDNRTASIPLQAPMHPRLSMHHACSVRSLCLVKPVCWHDMRATGIAAGSYACTRPPQESRFPLRQVMKLHARRRAWFKCQAPYTNQTPVKSLPNTLIIFSCKICFLLELFSLHSKPLVQYRVVPPFSPRRVRP